MSGVWQHEQLLARGRITQVDSPAGPIPAFRPAALPASFDPPMHPIPGVGEHTDALLAELGYGERVIAALHAAGAA